ncbi:unnamed protein product [Menidia menidia]|uniref:(Atlantic silverside) hypothetical protein n=1 Tax=Menidia menidia TaxID=238744 RepID=A0A8S4AM95_9TELE|nr:unnamed protein product [Menidia menidia]
MSTAVAGDGDFHTSFVQNLFKQRLAAVLPVFGVPPVLAVLPVLAILSVLAFLLVPRVFPALGVLPVLAFLPIFRVPLVLGLLPVLAVLPVFAIPPVLGVPPVLAVLRVLAVPLVLMVLPVLAISPVLAVLPVLAVSLVLRVLAIFPVLGLLPVLAVPPVLAIPQDLGALPLLQGLDGHAGDVGGTVQDAQERQGAFDQGGVDGRALEPAQALCGGCHRALHLLEQGLHVLDEVQRGRAGDRLRRRKASASRVASSPAPSCRALAYAIPASRLTDATMLARSLLFHPVEKM